MYLRVISNCTFSLGDGYFLVQGEIWKVSSNEDELFELECIKGMNIGMFQEFTRKQIADCFEVI